MVLTNMRGHMTYGKVMALLGKCISGLSCSHDSIHNRNAMMGDGSFCFMDQEIQSTAGGNVWEREEPTAGTTRAKDTAATVREQKEGPKCGPVTWGPVL